MLTAKLAVEAILDGKIGKAAIWAVNIDDDYHEETPSDRRKQRRARLDFRRNRGSAFGADVDNPVAADYGLMRIICI